MSATWLLDEMLARLARLMRAAGHDVALADPATPDRDLLARAAVEGRLLVTRDRDLAMRAGENAVRLDADGLDAQALELADHRDVDWLLAPFSRCLIDNTPLRAAASDEIAALPPKVRGLPGPFTVCPCCDRRYWPGSHAKHLRARLEDLARAKDQAV